MKLYFIRHGESEANVREVFGNSETPLTELGKKQANMLAERVSKLPIDSIYASDYVRTQQTCESITDMIKKEPIFIPSLREFRRPSELKDSKFNSKEIDQYFKQVEDHADDPHWHYSDEENFVEFKKRAQEFVQFALELKEENVLLVTHGAITRMIILTMMLGDNVPYKIFDSFWFFHSVNTGVTVIEREKNYFKLLTWNDYAHLAE